MYLFIYYNKQRENPSMLPRLKGGSGQATVQAVSQCEAAGV